jgi:DNA-binding YbaB/EbfC family protein
MPKFPGGGFGGLNINAMMKQVQKIQEDTEKMQQELAGERVEASSGGGMVTAVANGLAELIEVKISPEVVDPSDVEMLQDLVTSAVREAMERANELRKERMEEITGGLGLPPGMNLPGF